MILKHNWQSPSQLTPEQIQNPVLPDFSMLDPAAIQRLGHAASSLHLIGYGTYQGTQKLPDALPLLPLIKTIGMVAPEQVDIHPYIDTLREVSGSFNFAYALTRPSPRLREALLTKAGNKVAEATTEAVKKARATIDKLHIEEELQFLKDSKIENPREKLVEELQDLAKTTVQSIRTENVNRIQMGGHANLPELPQGKIGFFTKVVRKIRSFFGFMNKKPAINHEITAYDAGHGVRSTIESLLHNKTDTARRMPLLTHFLFNRLPAQKLPAADNMAFMAPEILNFIFSLLPNANEYQDMIESVTLNPHELRFVTRFKHSYNGFYLPAIQAASRNLLPALRDVLPDRTQKVSDAWQQTKNILDAFHPPSRGPSLKEQSKALKINEKVQKKTAKKEEQRSKKHFWDRTKTTST